MSALKAIGLSLVLVTLGVTVSVSETSEIRTGEGGESNEPGMGCECRVGKTRGVREEELAEEEDDRLGGFFVNLPVSGSRCGLLIKGVADGNQRSNVELGIRCEERTLDLPHWGSQMKRGLKVSRVSTQGRSGS